MYLNHSLTYKDKRIRNLPHRLRLKKIVRTVQQQCLAKPGYLYMDIGCSDGFITDIISRQCNYPIAKGMDHNEDNLLVAREKYQNIDFKFIDLNILPESKEEKYNLVTCFETLEHVGNLKNAIKTLISFLPDKDAKLLISVPIEIGFWGMVKYLAKMAVGYNVDELGNGATKISYFSALLFGSKISKFRDERDGWGTHFGFDYRDVDKILKDLNISYKAKNSFTSRFYIIEK